MNLRPPAEDHPTSNKSAIHNLLFLRYILYVSGFRWEEVGLWNSEKGATVDIRDILWPGEALKPPEGVPERGFLSVTFLEVDNRYVQMYITDTISRQHPDSNLD